MNNIGERLGEARKRKGISIREAAEATKVRGDFLAAFESGAFDIPLPEIYRRGFLKLYAKYLDLDTEQLMTDYNAVQLGNSRVQRHGGRGELFGRVDLPEPDAERREAGSPPARSQPPVESEATHEEELGPQSNREPLFDLADKTLWWKAGVLVAGVAVALFLIILLVNAITGGGTERPPVAEDDPPVVVAPDSGIGASAPSPLLANAPGSVTIIATGETWVAIKDISSGDILFNETLQGGQTRTVALSGEAEVAFTRGEEVTFETDNGLRFDPPREGMSRTRTTSWR